MKIKLLLNKLTSELEDEVIEMHNEGYTEAEIAEELCCQLSLVNNLCRRRSTKVLGKRRNTRALNRMQG